MATSNEKVAEVIESSIMSDRDEKHGYARDVSSDSGVVQSTRVKVCQDSFLRVLK